MTQEEFKNLGNGQHHGKYAEWNGKQWRLTWTYQSRGTVMLQPIGTRKQHAIATGYEHVKIIKL